MTTSSVFPVSGEYVLAKHRSVPLEHLRHVPRDLGPLGREYQTYRMVDLERDVVTTAESWALHYLRDDPEWIVAIRMGRDRNGDLVPTELRVFPQSLDRDRRVRGDWSREASDVPAGGLRARALRSINLQDHIKLARAKLFELAQDPEQRQAIEELVGSLPIRTPEKTWDQAAAARARGQRRTPEYLARLAQFYEEGCRKHPQRVVKELAERLGLNRTQVRDDVHEARRQGYLSNTRQGVAGGTITEKAREIIETQDPTDGL